MRTVSELIERHHSEILRSWTQVAHRAAAARELSPAELASTIPSYLALLGHGRLDEQAQLSDGQRQLVERHLSNRLREGFELNDILTEFSALGRCVLQFADGDAGDGRPTIPDIARLFAELYLTTAAVTQIFNEQLLEDEQTMKRYARLLRNLANKAVGLPAQAPPLRKYLHQALTLIMESTGTQTAALLLFDAQSHQLIMSASAGAADEHLKEYASSLSAHTFAGKIASCEGEVTTEPDAATTKLEITESLRQSGIHSLLGMRLSSGRMLHGVLYVGTHAKRAFSASTVRRLESLSEALAIHLDNARLFTAWQQRVDELGAEAELRERFASMLMHDLKGPLTAARVNVQLLSPIPAADVQGIAAKVLHSLDRLERMVDDFLDTHRIRAGERLPLTIGECDLASLAYEVVEELRAQHGDRFVLRGEKVVRGMWGAEELKRALWNLASNAIKYGARDTLVLIAVKDGVTGAKIIVHNDGPAIPPEEQARLFKPFTHTGAALEGTQRGWGLGLTLVWGCAEAHGGRVEVESLPGRGTTFTLVLPHDARPYADN